MTSKALRLSPENTVVTQFEDKLGFLEKLNLRHPTNGSTCAEQRPNQEWDVMRLNLVLSLKANTAAEGRSLRCVKMKPRVRGVERGHIPTPVRYRSAPKL